jgi:hypothetical protein
LTTITIDRDGANRDRLGQPRTNLARSIKFFNLTLIVGFGTLELPLKSRKDAIVSPELGGIQSLLFYGAVVLVLSQQGLAAARV